MPDVLFINATEKQDINKEINGTLLLATKLLQVGIDTEILRFCQVSSYAEKKNYLNFIHDMVNRILSLHPKCVSFYTLWPYFHIMLRLAKEIKAANPEIITIMGGPQSSATAKQTLMAADYVDFICVGEGEDVVVPFFKLLLEKKFEQLPTIPALYYRKDGEIIHNSLEVPLCDLNALPYWDDRLYLDKGNELEDKLTSDTYFMPIDAGRGCPYNCTFCSASLIWKRTYRLKSPDRIVEDIKYYNRKFGIRSFWFSHDAFTTNNRLVEAVCDKILEEKLDIKWRCSTRIDCISKELILKMQRAGLTEIELGVETGSERMQKIIKKRLNLSKAEEMINFLLENGINTTLFFMYGFPEETHEDLNQTLELLFSMLDRGVDYANMNFCRFNPNTAITEQYMDQLVLDPQIKVLSRQIFGYEEELNLIKQHRELFPFFYHLHTPVRDEFQYLILLEYLYRIFPNSIRFVRALYQGDYLRFYRDFVANNAEIFSEDIDGIISTIKADPVTIIRNTIKGFSLPYEEQLSELLRYEYDRRRISKLDGDVTEKITYGFSFLDFLRKRPIEQYCSAKSVILFQKSGNTTKAHLVDIL